MRLSDWIAFSPLFTKCFGKLPLSHLLYMVRQLRYENPHKLKGRRHINTFFPPIPSRPWDRFLEAVIARQRTPYSAYFAVTDRCPFKCPHCSYGHHKPGSLDTDLAKQVIAEVKSIGTITIGFTGGEPLVREDIVDLVAATGRDTQCIMFTTGTGLTTEKARALASAGLDAMTIGLESDDPDRHDGLRGVKGSFQDALDAVQMALDAGLYTAISTVATREKVSRGSIESMTRLATQLGCHEFRILEPIPTGKAQGKKEEILSAEQSKYLSDFHKNWNRAKRGVSIASFAFLESDEMFGCGAGYHHVFVDALGNVCPCDLTPLSFGNVLREPFEKIWQRMAEYFPLPRCGCMMKDICSEICKQGEIRNLPLSPEESIEICQAHDRGENLPAIWKNLLKDRQ